MSESSYRILFSDTYIVILGILSLLLIILSAYLSVFAPQATYWLVISVLMGTIGSTIFFPLMLGFYLDHLKEEKECTLIWAIFKEFYEGGILRVYKNRFKNNNEENGENDLMNAFINHKNGEIKMVGVSLRYFFHETAVLYNPIKDLCEAQNNNVKIKALVSHPYSIEVTNRAKDESPKNIDYPPIRPDIDLTARSIANLNAKYNSPIDYGYYDSAPYCTFVIFHDKCYFSPNILSNDRPVLMPMIVFDKNSYGYTKLNDYFDILWTNRSQLEELGHDTQEYLYMLSRKGYIKINEARLISNRGLNDISSLRNYDEDGRIIDH